MEKKMTDLSDATDALQATVDKLAADNAKALADLQAAIASGGDTSAAIAKLKAINTQLQGIDVADLAADPSTTPPPAPTAG